MAVRRERWSSSAGGSCQCSHRSFSASISALDQRAVVGNHLRAPIPKTSGWQSLRLPMHLLGIECGINDAKLSHHAGGASRVCPSLVIGIFLLLSLWPPCRHSYRCTCQLAYYRAMAPVKAALNGAGRIGESCTPLAQLTNASDAQRRQGGGLRRD